MPPRWKRFVAEGRAAISGEDAIDIPAPASGKPPSRVRLYFPARAPATARASGTIAALFRDFSDRSARGDPKALLEKYGGGFGPMAFGIPFMAVGGALLVFLPRQAPRQILPYVFGSIFALAGLLVFSIGLTALKAAAGGKQASEKEPWHSDHAWDPRGARPDAPGRSFTGCVGLTLFFLLIGVFNVMWTVRKDLSGWIVVTIVLVVFDALGLLLLASIVVALAQRVRAGVPRLSWRRFPFFTGGR